MADDLMQYETYRGLAKGLSNPMSHRQQREWLHRSKDWPDLGGENNYKARKIVGAGGHGICGLWEYTGDSPDKPKHLVVKQVGTKDEGLRVESKLMRDIMRAGGSDHIVKLYKSAYSEGGSGTSKARDPWPFTSGGKYRKKYQVSRLFMEYCENGNLASEIAEVVRNGYDLPEEYIWRAFECLASALVFLDHGNEETDDDAETWDSPISHFDIKPGNSKFQAPWINVNHHQ
jgi:serine/threonine protein kinase